MTTKDISEADCWFVIGAYQAGATERQCAELSGLTKSSAHNIISNFKKLGSPHATSFEVKSLLNQAPKKRARNKNDNDGQPRKRGRPRKAAEEPFFTQSLMKRVLLEASNRTADQEETLLPTRLKQEERVPHDRLDTPPSDDDIIKVLRRDSEESTYSFLPPTPRSPLELLDDEEAEEWSLDDDKALLSHVLNLGCIKKNIKWKELEAKMNDRHLAMICSERWDFLKKQMLKDVADTQSPVKHENK